MATSVAIKKPSSEVLETAISSVFQPGRLEPHDVIKVDKDHGTNPPPPVPILIASPKDAGTYPVAMFLHGFSLQNQFYKQVLKHVASFGFIMVAPQFQSHVSLRELLGIDDTSDTEDIDAAAKVTDWLTKGLPSVLPEGVKPNLSKLALAGHSRGGHTAFSLARKTGLKFSALIGLDPVAGSGKSSQILPKILTYEPASFDIAMPVLVIGTGLGEEKKNILFPPCAPKDVSHMEFYHECKPPCYYFVTKEYGHVDMLDDDVPMSMKLMTWMFIKEGKNSKDVMRRTVAGIMVAFLKAVLNEDDDGDLRAILKDPKLAPTTLDPVAHRLA